jgi:hypothetical protein
LDLEITDDEDEIVTPPGTWSESDSRWRSDPRTDGVLIAVSSGDQESWKKHMDDDDEIMKAALALCGLQNRRVQ